MQIYRPFADLKKFHIEARDGKIGRPADFYFDDRHWVVRYLVVRTGSWLFGREVLITPAMLGGLDDRKKTLRVDLTREQVEKSPPLETARPVSRYYEEQYFRYYSWQPYWKSDPLLMPEAPPLFYPVPEEPAGGQVPDIHLRSSNAVSGYTLLAVDGEIGQVKDFIVGDEEWRIRYLEVVIGNWLTGKKMVVSPTWITDVNWLRREVSVKLTRESIKSAPEYDPAQLISRDFELQVFKHYSAGTGKTQEDEQ
ncbi:MAG: PRC-barrel domain-containing protein [Thermodesulfobacteriota bacterium]